ncbi:hypothetical protein RU07_22415 [Agrobacterium tumefaciens]|uniref:Uncharacterized protein n=1 Tax=Agrobacterium tumefaciens TaxID=358 RepID=A0A0D0JRW0_AGRTU|nr:hypothetical protein RU07_22415 [Agrobacterium tumefaciens]
MRRAFLWKISALNPDAAMFNPISVKTNADGARKFPLAASARIILARVRSEKARRRRAFSVSNSFQPFA